MEEAHRLLRARRHSVSEVALRVGYANPSKFAAAFRKHYSGPRRRLAVEVLERAQRRGQLRADVDPRIVVDQLWGACYHRLLIPDEPVTKEFVTGLLANLMRGLRPETVDPANANAG
jgi:hypothetical protein